MTFYQFQRATCLVIAVNICMAVPVAWASVENQVADVLDSFHQAASDANGEQYFDLLTEDSVFIGTDGSERWSKAQFKQFAAPYFGQGRGWTYYPRDRHIQLSPAGDVAWFDEMLDNQSYGECRGTGVLLLTEQGWKIIQYHLTIPVPNDLAKALVKQIKQHNKEK